jgi:hypothetical protein
MWNGNFIIIRLNSEGKGMLNNTALYKTSQKENAAQPRALFTASKKQKNKFVQGLDKRERVLPQKSTVQPDEELKKFIAKIYTGGLRGTTRGQPPEKIVGIVPARNWSK